MSILSPEKTVLVLPMQGADGGTIFTDVSASPKTFTTYGNAKTSIVQSKYYGSSGYFDGSGDWITTPNVSAFDLSLSTTLFTIQGWIYPTLLNTYRGIMGARANGATHGWCLYVRSNGTLWMGSIVTGYSYTDRQLSTITIPANTWTHFALVKNLAGYTAYINGVGGSLLALTGGLNYQAGQPLNVGSLASAGEYPYIGYMQDIAIHTGIALYNSNFTPPASFLDQYEISGTILDTGGVPCSRQVHLYSQFTGVKIASTTSDPTTGQYSFSLLNDQEVFRVVIANEGALYNNIIDRINPVPE